MSLQVETTTGPVMFEPVTIAAVHAEIIRAQVKHGWRNTPLNPERTDEANLPVLVEEVGEVAKAMTYDNSDSDLLVKELIQVAAMALAWAQAVDERGAN